MRGTYSLEDNKLRLYPSSRLDKEDYKKFSDLGYKWAAGQKIFVAPMWTPKRFDLLLEFCGDVQDEDQTLMERAEARSDRFEGYSERRSQDSDNAYKTAKDIADHIPSGQPILVDHYSAKRSISDRNKIDTNMRKSINMQKVSEYWANRAANSIAHAEYKDKPDVRARRIKKLSAEMGKRERNVKACEVNLKLWQDPDLDQQKAEFIAGKISYRHDFYCDIREKKITVSEAKERAIKSEKRSIEFNNRWIEHYQLRIEYETNILKQQNGLDLLKPKERKKSSKPPIKNHDTSILIENVYANEPLKLEIQRMTKSEWKDLYEGFKSIRCAIDKSHRVRVAMIERRLKQVFITDSKAHKVPE